MTRSSVELELEAQRITKKLGGSWHGSGGMACCPAHNDSKPSLSISVGRTTVLLHCFAGCDFVDVIRAIRLEGALPGGNLPTGHNDSDLPIKDYAPLARRIFSEARSLAGTLGERHLRARGLVGPWTDLRYHPHTPIGSGALTSYRPAIIAAVRDNSGLVAIHRIVLDPRTGGKATDLENPKLTLGRPKGGAVRLFKAGRTLGLAEGIETAKSAARMLSIPVWATLGSERFAHVEIPFDVTTLFLLRDRGAAGDRAVVLGREAHARPGLTIKDPLPPGLFNDWNDADQADQGIPARA